MNSRMLKYSVINKFGEIIYDEISGFAFFISIICDIINKDYIQKEDGPMKRNYLINIAILLVIFSFLISTVISVRTMNSVINRENKNMATLLANTIYTDIDAQLQQYIISGKSIANSQELISLISHEDDYTREEMESLLKKDLGHYSEAFEVDSVFVVTKNQNYYTEVGFNKHVSPETDAHDIWYSSFLDTGKEYEFNIDVDEVNNGDWTVFINVRMYDEQDNLIAVCGIGKKITEIQSMLLQMREDYDIEINLVDSYGNVQVTVDNGMIRKEYDDHLVLSDTTEDFVYTEDHNGYVMTKNMSDLGWTLIIRRNVSNYEAVTTLIAKNIAVMMATFMVFLIIAMFILKRSGKMMAENVVRNSYGNLSSIYKGMYIMNYHNDTVKEIKNLLSTETHLFLDYKPMSPQVEIAIRDWVLPEFADQMRAFFDFSTIEERMAGKDYISSEFIAQQIGWSRARFIAVRKAENTAIEYVIFALEVIDEEKRQNESLRMESEAAREASEAKGRFLANMSHEIRTPINAVLGMDTMILREAKNPKIREYAMDIQNAGRTLLSLVNDILDFSKIESGKMKIVPVDYDFSVLINDVVNMINERVRAKKLELILKVDEKLPIGLYGDDMRIRQILLNILSNAVKYTEKGSITFTVTGHLDGDKGDKVLLHFAVKDTGIGIKEEDIAKLFTAFERIEESRNRNVEGTGLGMNITMQLLNLMDSKLEVTSVYGEGSEFSFDLVQKVRHKDPIGSLSARIVERANEYEYEVSFIAPDAKVLVVDDNSMNRAVFVNLLKDTQLQIEEAAGGKEALSMIDDKAYDLIFLDDMMPDLSGVEVLKDVKSRDNHPNVNTPIIVLTANAISGAKAEYMAVGFNDYISKPVIPEKLERKVAKYLPDDKKQLGKRKVIAKSVEDEGFNFEELPSIEGLDWNYAVLHFSQKEPLLNALKAFSNSCLLDADELSKWLEGIKDGDDNAMDQYRIKVHSMKSSANLLGMVPLAGTAAMLEYAARANNKELILTVTPYFVQTWRQYKNLLTVLWGNEVVVKKNIVDTSDVVDYLHQLVETTSNFDVKGADAALEHLQMYAYSPEMADLLNKISGAVNNLDADNVEIWCQEMIELLERE